MGKAWEEMFMEAGNAPPNKRTSDEQPAFC